ncbi:TetR/AcrR family transcriptional regulator [Sorangium sp. So ce1000]|uniref:TetR/AcrR family transcriptional regulator n=1 Tax=Sorangium sp. So ce1000 TaxID=3133325 RepID=UPI003F62D2DF
MLTIVIEGAPSSTEDPRRRKLMDAALTVFLRFGFRKTSMDEVARAAGVSRQGLYLHFSTKEELFRASVGYFLDAALAAVTAALAAAERPLEERLVAAFDAWIGRFVGALGADAGDLSAATSELVGPLVAEHEGRFVEAVAEALRASGLSAAYEPAGITARQLADILVSSARGLKHGAATRDAFVEGMTIAARVVCLPELRARAAQAGPSRQSRQAAKSRPADPSAPSARREGKARKARGTTR